MIGVVIAALALGEIVSGPRGPERHSAEAFLARELELKPRFPLLAENILIVNDAVDVEDGLVSAQGANMMFAKHKWRVGLGGRVAMRVGHQNVLRGVPVILDLAASERSRRPHKCARCPPNPAGGGLADVVDLEVDRNGRSDGQRAIWSRTYRNVGPELFLARLSRPTNGVPGYAISGSGLQQGPDYQDGPKGRQKRGKPTREYLLFDGISSPYLGVQILGIMLAAFGLSSLSGYSLFRAFDHSHRNRASWIALAAASGVCGLTFYGWGWMGHPLRFWGLA